MPKTQANRSRVHVVPYDVVVVVANKDHEIAHQRIRSNKEGNKITYCRDTPSWFSPRGFYRYSAFTRHLQQLCHDDKFLERTQDFDNVQIADQYL